MILINTTDLLGPDWRFLEPVCTNPAISWEIHFGHACNTITRRVRGIDLRRYRTAIENGRVYFRWSLRTSGSLSTENHGIKTRRG
jgi:hypothetical protein